MTALTQGCGEATGELLESNGRLYAGVDRGHDEATEEILFTEPRAHVFRRSCIASDGTGVPGAVPRQPLELLFHPTRSQLHARLKRR